MASTEERCNMKENISKFLKNPLNVVTSGWRKIIIGPLKYGKKGTYDAI